MAHIRVKGDPTPATTAAYNRMLSRVPQIKADEAWAYQGLWGDGSSLYDYIEWVSKAGMSYRDRFVKEHGLIEYEHYEGDYSYTELPE